MDKQQGEPQFEGLTDFDTFLWLLEERHGFGALKDVAREVQLANLNVPEVVDLRKRDDGKFNMFCKAGDAPVAIVLSKGRDGRFHAEEGGFLRK